MTLHEFPALNATLNACATVMLITGMIFIKAGKQRAHIVSMTTALLFSTVFLACYLYYHFHVGDAKFQGTGWSRPVYFTILITHIPLAVISLPMIIMTVIPAVQQRFDKHKRLAKWTLPVWLYVSVTGVIVYLMCYRWYGPPLLPALHAIGQ